MRQNILGLLLQLPCLLPIIGIASWHTKRFDIKSIGLFMVLYLASSLCLYMPSPSFMSGLDWNWWGKLLSILLGLGFMYFQNKEAYPEFGFTTQFNPNSIKVVTITFVVLAFLAASSYFFDGFSGYKVETLLYQATMPGLEEELWFRGILLYYLNRSFGKSWTFFGAKMGWGVIIITVLFGLAHGLGFDKNYNLQFDLGTTIATAIIGFIYAWSRERSGSIIPGILGHNLFNFVQQF